MKIKIIILILIISLGLAGFFIFRNSASEEKNATTVTQQKEKIIDSNNINSRPMNEQKNIIFLHHSTGENIWNGGLPEWLENYNQNNSTSHQITEQNFPKDSPYGWENYPFDYWNIWVNHAGESYFQEEPTLEILTKDYDLIIFKHCFPVSDIEADTGSPDIASSEKTIENYKLQYNALKEKMLEFPATKFLVWTGAAQVKNATDAEMAARAQEFFTWVKNEWDKKGDNIFVWDFWQLETEGGLYLKNEYAESSDDSHPNASFSKKVAPYLGQRVIDVMTGQGDNKNITGK